MKSGVAFLGLAPKSLSDVYADIATIARITGETAPLLFTALNNQFWSVDPNAPMASLPVTIFQFALSPYSDWQQLAWTGALIITFAVLTLNVVARFLSSLGSSK